MKYFIIISFLLVGTTSSFTQTWEVGAWVGGTNSFNDINTNSNFKTTRPAGGLLGKYNLNDRIAGELMVSYGRTYSSDQKLGYTNYHENRNEGSRTTSFDFALSGEFNFLPINISGQTFTQSYDYSPYLSAGVGVTFLDAAMYSRRAEDWISASSILAEDDQELNNFQVTVPIAAGVKYRLNNSFVLSGEFGTRILFTDYYDYISTVYNQTGIEHSPGNIVTEGRQRGDRSRNDAYNLFGMQLTYLIPTGKCPNFTR